MTKLVKLLLNFKVINEAHVNAFDRAHLKQATMKESKKTLNLVIDLEEPLTIDIFAILMKNRKLQDITFKYEFNILSNEISLDALYDYLIYFQKSINEFPMMLSNFERKAFEIRDGMIIFKYFTDVEKKEIKLNERKLLNFLTKKAGFNIVGIDYMVDRSYQEKKIKEEKIKEDLMMKIIEQQKRSSSELTKIAKRNEVKAKAIPLSEISASDIRAVIQGEIFKLTCDTTKKGNKIFKFYITDYTNSIMLKVFSSPTHVNENMPLGYLESFKIKTWIKAKVDLANDQYERNDLTAMIRQVFPIETPKEFIRADHAEHKRIELMCHTNMSAFDGIAKPHDIIQQIKQYQQPAIAFTDKFNVQAYPEIMKASKEYSTKVIYGAELEVLDKVIPLVLNPTKDKIRNREWIVFDLETTGFYPAHEDIIEFGGIRYRDGNVIEKKQFFIKPTKEIPYKITQLTNITNDNIKDAIDQKAGLQQIVNWIGDGVLIAHNAIGFDFAFLNSKLEQYKLPLLKNTVIDSLIISRAINVGFKSHTLSALARKNRVAFDEVIAHRADYDAEILLDVWLKLLGQIEKLGVKLISDINPMLQSDNLRLRSFGYNVNIYAKNQRGIRDIYEIISFIHTKGFYGRPTITFEKLCQYHNNIIITNSPVEGDVWRQALFGTKADLNRVIDKYDYLLLCPPGGLSHEIKVNNISEKNVIKTINNIIKSTQAKTKLCIAVSNAYYINPRDKDYHDVYIFTKGLGGRRHRYYRNKTGPTAHIRTTDEMLKEFAFITDNELRNNIVVDNTYIFNDQIDCNVAPLQSKLFTPSIEGVNDKVTDMVYKNAHKIYGDNLNELIEKQIEKELHSIIGNGYAVVYWVSHLLVEKSINDGYVVGSRGSVGSSLVATLLNITDVNPLPPHYLCKKCQYSEFITGTDDGFDLPSKNCPKCKTPLYGEGHNIPFETFLGFKGDKVPDIDLNFSGVYQPRAHNFIKEMFGADKAFRAGTISTVAEKTSFGYVKGYFEEIGQIDEVRNAEILRYAANCMDVKRTTGQHPGGIVIVPQDMNIYDFTPYNYPADDITQDWFTTHFAFEYIHDNLLKFDILGHDNPTALKMLKDITGIDEKDVPNNDAKTMQLFNSLDSLNIKPEDIGGETTGAISLPEFGTKFVREMLRDTQPQSFADLVRISGLSHGTDVWIGNAKSLISNGLKLVDVIGCRDDIMVYLIKKGVDAAIAFRVMEDVRKGRGIKPADEKILKECNIDQWYIDSANKIKYMFPKAHATAYVTHAWKFAWYKLYYPLEYYATYFTIRPDVFDLGTIVNGKAAILEKVKEIKTSISNPQTKNLVKKKEKDLLIIYEVVLEMIARGYEMANIDILKSDATNYIVDGNKIIPPFKAIDGLGEAVAESIIRERSIRAFISKEDLATRTKLTKTHLAFLVDNHVLEDLCDDNQISLFDL